MSEDPLVRTVLEGLKVVDVGERRLVRVGSKEERYVIYMPTDRNYLWRELWRRRARIRVVLQVVSEGVREGE